MASTKVKRQKVPALVGLREAAEILGVHKSHVRRIKELPEPLGNRRIEGFDVSAGPLWVRSEIEELADRRAAVKA